MFHWITDRVQSSGIPFVNHSTEDHESGLHGSTINTEHSRGIISAFCLSANQRVGQSFHMDALAATWLPFPKRLDVTKNRLGHGILL